MIEPAVELTVKTWTPVVGSDTDPFELRATVWLVAVPVRPVKVIVPPEAVAFSVALVLVANVLVEVMEPVVAVIVAVAVLIAPDEEIEPAEMFAVPPAAVRPAKLKVPALAVTLRVAEEIRPEAVMEPAVAVKVAEEVVVRLPIEILPVVDESENGVAVAPPLICAF